MGTVINKIKSSNLKSFMINMELVKKLKNKTFLRRSAIIPMRVRTCWRDSPSRGTPSANLSTLSAIGSHRWRMNSDTYARNTRSGLPRRSRTSLEMIQSCHSSQWSPISKLRSVTCHMGSHITRCYLPRHRWMHPALNPAKQAGTWFTYPEGWKAELHTKMVYLSADSHRSRE